ncbi:uncharacterized protein [Rutidosis leptorrhynchoides]|uniref:uncharacterized protein n=1 Tax=Rutidosis leptorrhynchoides TaxID=125765 RepID=UPI003A99551C
MDDSYITVAPLQAKMTYTSPHPNLRELTQTQHQGDQGSAPYNPLEPSSSNIFISQLQQVAPPHLAQSLEVAPTTEKFAAHIENHPFPEAPVISLTLGSYDGLLNPDDLLQRFEGTARTHNWGDAVACHMLLILLHGVAREWFNNLTPRSITGYADLRYRFLLNFHSLRARRRTHVECHDIKQKPKESLGEVIDRYTKEVAKIPDLPESQKLSGFIHCLDTKKHLSLWQRLRRKVPQTFAEAIKEAHDYMRAQEDITKNCGKGYTGRNNDDDHHRDHGKGSGSAKRYNNNSPLKGGSYNNNNKCRRFNTSRGGGSYKSKSAHDDNYVTIKDLSKTPKKILATEPVCKTFEAPTPLLDYAKKDKTKFCDFHHYFGRETNKCRQLIERVVTELKRGRLQHLKKSAKTEGNKSKQEKGYPWQKKSEPKAKEAEKTINMVISENVMKEPKEAKYWKKAIISFGASERQWLNEPLIVKGYIKSCNQELKGLCVDTGCDIDIIYEHCYISLPRSVKSQLKKKAVTLYDFAGDLVPSLGTVRIKLELRDDNNGKKRRDLEIEFAIVKSKAEHNALLSRNTLQKLGAIPSTVHGLLKFPTKWGVTTIKSEVDRKVRTIQKGRRRERKDAESYKQQIAQTIENVLCSQDLENLKKKALE